MWYLLVFLVVKVLKALSLSAFAGLIGYLAIKGVGVLIDLNDGIESNKLLNNLKHTLIVSLSLLFLYGIIPDKKEALIILGAGAMLETGVVEKGLEKIEKFVEEL